MGILNKALRSLGVDAQAFNTFHSYLGYRDYIFNVDQRELEKVMSDALDRFEVFHFHYGRTMHAQFMDLPYLKRMNKKRLMHHWGNDVRTETAATRNNPYAYTGDSPPAEHIHRTLCELSRFVDDAIVQDYEVYPYVSDYYERVHVVPIAFDVHNTTPSYPTLENDMPLVVHAPTNPLFKGTAQIEAAMERLREEGCRFEYRRVEKMSNAEALQLYRRADIVVDQILCGSYGLLAVESMALGKPVVGFIREDLVSMFPEAPPIESATPDTVQAVVRALLTDPQRRRTRGWMGRKYAEKHHDTQVVATKLLAIYNQI